MDLTIEANQLANHRLEQRLNLIMKKIQRRTNLYHGQIKINETIAVQPSCDIYISRCMIVEANDEVASRQPQLGIHYLNI